jgi:hypothetical protein
VDSADVGAANAWLGSTRLAEMRLEVPLAEAHRPAYPQVREAPSASELVDSRDRKPQQVRDLAGRKELVVKPHDAVAHERFLRFSRTTPSAFAIRTGLQTDRVGRSGIERSLG